MLGKPLFLTEKHDDQPHQLHGHLTLSVHLLKLLEDLEYSARPPLLVHAAVEHRRYREVTKQLHDRCMNPLCHSLSFKILNFDVYFQ